MATATAILKKAYKLKDGTYPIVIRVINGKKQSFHSVGYRVREDQFKSGLVTKHKDAVIINSKISEKLSKARKYIADCKERNRPIDFRLMFSAHRSHSFIDYLRQRSKEFKARGMVVMRQKADRFVKELQLVFQELYFDQLNRQAIERYDSYLQKVGNSANTRHKKIEFLGKFFQDAVRDGKAEGPNPFREYKIKTTPVGMFYSQCQENQPFVAE